MAGSVHDSSIYHRLFPAGDLGKLFSDSAEVRAMLLVEGALAKVQGSLGVIPEVSAAAIHRASLEIPLDPAGLSEAVATNGVPVPGLVAAFRKEMQAPEHSQYVHWGATSQDIADTGLMLRMRQVLDLTEKGLTALLTTLADLAEAHADLPMAGRTYGQHATPVGFGAVVAHWGAPLADLRDALPALREQVLWVSLSGAAGTGAAFGDTALETRAKLAEALGLRDPGRSWHADRSPVLALSAWMARLALALGKMGEDLIALTMSGIGEVRLGATGGSSTMPQKQNPVQPSALVALGRQVAGLNATMQSAAMPRNERDGAAWFTEWLTLPQLILSTAAALNVAQGVTAGVQPDAVAMKRTLDAGQGLMLAEALTFRLAADMPRPEAQAQVKEICKTVMAEGSDLATEAQKVFPDRDLGDLFDMSRQLGTAPDEARAFAARIRG